MRKGQRSSYTNLYRVCVLLYRGVRFWIYGTVSGQYRVHLHATHVSDESRDVPRDALNMIYDSDPLVHD